VPTTRDFLRFGSILLVPTSSPNFYVKDIEVFNTVKHIANFPSEIPRAVNIFPLESFIEPLDVSVADGVEGIIQNAVTNPTDNVNYVLKIESQYKYIDGGALEESDKTLAQSNTIAEWEANLPAISAFISSGARIVLCPVLYSAPSGISTPELISYTLDYDFFAIPVSCEECTVYGFLIDNCENVASASIRFYTDEPFLSQGNVVSLDETITDADKIDITNNGLFEMGLIIPDQGTIYNVDFELTSTDNIKFTLTKRIAVPNQTTAIFNDIAF